MFLNIFNRMLKKLQPESSSSSTSSFKFSQYIYKENLIDIPQSLIFEESGDIAKWLSEGTNSFREICNQIPLEKPIEIFWNREQPIHSGILHEYILQWSNKHPLINTSIGGALARPAMFDKQKPIAVFIHGHGMVGGQDRSSLFTQGSPANYLLERGYIVWAPDNVYHGELLSLFVNHDFPLMWAKVAADSRIFIEKNLQNSPRFVLIGVAAGGHTALGMQLYSGDYEALVTSGSFFPLDLLRRDFRIQGHPNCFDFRDYVSYLPLFSLCLNNPMQLQMGKNDALWIGGSLKMQTGVFSGTKRGVFTEESGGGILILKYLAKKVSANNHHFSFLLHDGGHIDIDIQQAVNFLDRHKL